VTSRRQRPLLATLATAVVLGAWAWQASVGDARSGQDYGLIIWAPWHGLLAGFDPYEASAAYLSAFHVSLASTLHAPAILLLAGPLSMSDQMSGFHLLTVANVVILWAAALVVVPPRTWRRAAATIALGLLLTFTGPGFFALRLGQVTSLAALGLALVIRWPRSRAAVAGVALLAVNPQLAIPLSILLVGMGYRRAVVGGIALTALLSAPILAWATVNAGGVGNLVTSMADSLRASSGTQTRVDLVGAYGDGRLSLTLAACAATVAGAVWLHRRNVEMTPVAALTATAWCLATFYTQPYSLDLAILAAFPVLLVRPWRAVELCAFAFISVSVLTSWAAMGLETTLLDISIDVPWNLGNILSGFLMTATAIVGVRRLAAPGGPAAGLVTSMVAHVRP
jgi:hypothetical protein